MSEDLRRYVPGEMMKRVSDTWPGFLSIAIDAILYDAVEKDNKFQVSASKYCPQKHGGHGKYVDVRKTLTAARDLLEAMAFHEIWSERCSTMTEKRYKEIAAKEEPR